MIKEYIRTDKGAKKGIIVAFAEGDKVLIGYSLCKLKMDRFDRERGIAIAEGRARKIAEKEEAPQGVAGCGNPGLPLQGILDEIPQSILVKLGSFVRRAKLYYKDKEFPQWTQL